MKAMLKSALLTFALVGFVGLSAPGHAAENPALWKYQVKGDFNTVLAGLKAGLAASPDDFPQFRQALAYAYVRLGMLDEAEPL